jgi:hypothetical protein
VNELTDGVAGHLVTYLGQATFEPWVGQSAESGALPDPGSSGRFGDTGQRQQEGILALFVARLAILTRLMDARNRAWVWAKLKIRRFVYQWI